MVSYLCRLLLCALEALAQQADQLFGIVLHLRWNHLKQVLHSTQRLLEFVAIGHLMQPHEPEGVEPRVVVGVGPLGQRTAEHALDLPVYLP